MHMFWLCPHLWEYKSKFFVQVFGKVVDPHPLTGLFGVSAMPNSPPNYTRSHCFLHSACKEAHSPETRALYCPPIHHKWIHEKLRFIKLKKIWFYLRGSLKHSTKCFFAYSDNLNKTGYYCTKWSPLNTLFSYLFLFYIHFVHLLIVIIILAFFYFYFFLNW